MNKRILLIAVFLLLPVATAFAQRHLHSTDRQDETTKSSQSKTRKESVSKHSHGVIKVDSDDKNFAMKAAASGRAEIDMGQMAARQASNEEVKQFAQRLVDDHLKANSELMQLAQSKGITLPAAVSPGVVDTINDSATTATGQHISGAVGQQKAGAAQHSEKTVSEPVNKDSNKAVKNSGHKKMMDKMAKLSGAEFDREFMKHQVADHDKAVALFEKQSRNGKDAELKAFALRTLPTLKEHQQQAREIHSRVSGRAGPSARTEKRDTK